MYEFDCHGKQRFANRGEALRVVAIRCKRKRSSRSKKVRSGKGHKPAMTPYRCPHCDGWHLG